MSVKSKNIHVLSTNGKKASYLAFDRNRKLRFSEWSHPYASVGGWIALNIYITSDEEIKEGDYGLVVNEILSYNKMIELWGVTQGWKIILTTDQDLIKDGVQAIYDEFLEWFVKNPSCEEVVFSTYHVKGDISGKLHYQIIIPKEDGIDFMANELVIEKERMYSEEDMVKSFIAGVDCNSSGGKNFEQFIEQLKKITPIARISAINIMEDSNVTKVQDEVVNPLIDPLNHSLEVLLNEIKRGRPAETQQLIQSWIEQLNK